MDTGSPYTGGGASQGGQPSGVIGQLEALLDEYLVRKAPFALPAGAKDVIVKIAPFLILILAILAIPVVLAAVGLSAFMTPFAMMGDSSGSMGAWAVITGIILLLSLVLELAAVPGLFRRTRKGWRLAFYASLVSLVGNLLSMAILSGIIGAIIGWYFLFQVKDRYQN